MGRGKNEIVIDTSSDFNSEDSSTPCEIQKMIHKKKRGAFNLSKQHKLFSIAILGIFVLFIWYFQPSSTQTQYVIVIDAGSSGSRIHVYPYIRGKGPLIELKRGEDFQKKLKPGLSSYTDPDDTTHPLADATKGIGGLLELAREQVPANQRASTPVFLYATAGMRKVQQDHPKETEQCMEIVRDTIQASEFMFQRDWAQIITGIDEGLYGWVTANYLNQYLSGHEVDAQSTGVLEMGGESVQLTFIPSESSMKFIPKDKLRPLKLGNTEFQVFTYSWMGVGMESVQGKHDEANSGKSTPCYIQGVTREGDNSLHGQSWEGAGDFDKCVESLKPFAKASDKCTGVNDAMMNCILDGTMIPKIKYEQLYYIENFLYTGSDLNPSHNGADYYKDITQKGKEFCSWTKDEVMEKYPDMSDFNLKKTCFGLAWINVLLDVGFGLNDYTRFEVVREVEGGDIDWAMGYGIQYASSHSGGTFTWTMYVIIFILIVALIFVAQKGNKKQRYQRVSPNAQFPL